MSDSEEDDYMSLKFLEGAEEYEKERKQLSYSEKRKQQLREQEKKGYIKPRAQIEEEERQKGLETAVSGGNKGMKMLMKMGFKPGMGLGKDGIKEPIKVELKSGRQGIGLESQLKRAREEELEEEARKRVELDPEDFRASMARKVKENQLIRYLRAAVSICQKLDEDNNVESNILWVLKPSDDDKEVEENDQLEENKEKEKDEEIEEEESVTEDESSKLPYPIEEIEELKSLKIEDQFEKVHSYLRSQYHYCFWCRVKYNDLEDMEANCAGTEEDDH